MITVRTLHKITESYKLLSETSPANNSHGIATTTFQHACLFVFEVTWPATRTSTSWSGTCCVTMTTGYARRSTRRKRSTSLSGSRSLKSSMSWVNSPFACKVQAKHKIIINILCHVTWAHEGETWLTIWIWKMAASTTFWRLVVVSKSPPSSQHFGTFRHLDHYGSLTDLRRMQNFCSFFHFTATRE